MLHDLTLSIALADFFEKNLLVKIKFIPIFCAESVISLAVTQITAMQKA